MVNPVIFIQDQYDGYVFKSNCYFFLHFSIFSIPISGTLRVLVELLRCHEMK